MSDSNEIRMGLLRMRKSHEWFANRCGMGVGELKEMFEGGELSEGVRGEYAALLWEVESPEVEEEKDVVEDVVEKEEEVLPIEQEKEKEHKGCVFGRPVRNAILQLVVFTDGSEGMIRKKAEFKPKPGLPCEVETSDEEGFLNLVGKYRPNGVRLD